MELYLKFTHNRRLYPWLLYLTTNACYILMYLANHYPLVWHPHSNCLLKSSSYDMHMDRTTFQRFHKPELTLFPRNICSRTDESMPLQLTCIFLELIIVCYNHIAVSRKTQCQLLAINNVYTDSSRNVPWISLYNYQVLPSGAGGHFPNISVLRQDINKYWQLIIAWLEHPLSYSCFSVP